jgi:hypothetical protein
VAGGLYSVPYRHIGQTLAVRLAETTVQFYHDEQLVKTHLRLPGKGRQTDWNDYPPQKAAFYQRTPAWCRTQAATLGPEVARAVDGLLAQHALHYLRQCQGIIHLAGKYGPARLNAACQRALAFGDASYRTVRTILEKGLEGQLALPFDQAANPAPGAYLHGPQALFSNQANNREQEKNDD